MGIAINRIQHTGVAGMAPGLSIEGAAIENDLAFLLAREGRDLDRALELALEAKQAFGEDPEVADTLGFVMLQRGLAGPAAEQFLSALRLAEERGRAVPGIHYHMGLALRALGQEKAAEQHLERALSIDPEFGLAAAGVAALAAQTVFVAGLLIESDPQF